MPLETATYLSQLNAGDPAEGDDAGQGADHLRLIKSCLLATFPNWTAAALQSTQAAIDAVVSALYSRTGFGAVPVGSLHSFPADPGTTVAARGGTATGTEQYILLDGSTYASSKFPALAASPHVTVSGSNFTVPNLMDTGRFLRASTSSVTPGTKQSNQNAAHTHDVTDNGHTHGVTDHGHAHGVNDPGHAHSVTPSLSQFVFNASPGSIDSVAGYIGGPGSTNPAVTSISIATAGTGVSVNSGTTGVSINSQGGTEARPEAFTVFMVMKT
jgi:hypothetical protein